VEAAAITAAAAVAAVAAAAAVGVCRRNASGFFHDRIVGVLHRGVAIVASLHRWRYAGPPRGRKPFLARARGRDSESDNFFSSPQSVNPVSLAHDC